MSLPNSSRSIPSSSSTSNPSSSLSSSSSSSSSSSFSYWSSHRTNVSRCVNLMKAVLSHLGSTANNDLVPREDLIIWYGCIDGFRELMNTIADKHSQLCQTCVNALSERLPCCSVYFACKSCLSDIYHNSGSCPNCRNEEDFKRFIEHNNWVGPVPASLSQADDVQELHDEIALLQAHNQSLQDQIEDLADFSIIDYSDDEKSFEPNIRQSQRLIERRQNRRNAEQQQQAQQQQAQQQAQQQTQQQQQSQEPPQQQQQSEHQSQELPQQHPQAPRGEQDDKQSIADEKDQHEHDNERKESSSPRKKIELTPEQRVTRIMKVRSELVTARQRYQDVVIQYRHDHPDGMDLNQVPHREFEVDEKQELSQTLSSATIQDNVEVMNWDQCLEQMTKMRDVRHKIYRVDIRLRYQEGRLYSRLQAIWISEKRTVKRQNEKEITNFYDYMKKEHGTNKKNVSETIRWAELCLCNPYVIYIAISWTSIQNYLKYDVLADAIQIEQQAQLEQRERQQQQQ